MAIGYFGASTGGSAALVAAAELGDHIKAVVSRGGRPDLAGSALPLVIAPTLLIVGALDYPVIAINRDALNQLKCEKSLQIVPRATHLLEEPGTLEQVGRLAADWFAQHFPLTEFNDHRSWQWSSGFLPETTCANGVVLTSPLRSPTNTPKSVFSKQRTAATPNLVANKRSKAPGAPSRCT